MLAGHSRPVTEDEAKALPAVAAHLVADAVAGQPYGRLFPRRLPFPVRGMQPRVPHVVVEAVQHGEIFRAMGEEMPEKFGVFYLYDRPKPDPPGA
jgi:hypothetical protein